MKLSDNQEQAIIAAIFFCAGISAAIFHHDTTTAMREQIKTLTEANIAAINLNDTLMHCAPNENGRAIITRKNNQFFCEIHIDRRSH